MFDMLLALCTLIGLAGVVRARRGARAAWIVCGIGVGLGILAKGPVALLHVFVPAMLVRFWAGEQRPRWTHWTMGMLLALAIAAGIALAWALPAAMRGGPEYRAAIFWGQSAGRVVESIAHRHPFWWYVPMLPLLIFPWWLYPRAWRGVHALFRSPLDSGTRFCLTWIVSIVALFSVISGKQLQYLLPLVPAFALMLARALTSEGSFSTIASEPSAGSRVKSPLAFALGSGGAFAIISVAGMQFLAPPGLDVTGVARYLKRLEDEGRPVAHMGKYYGQYQFTGRLERPLAVVQREAIGDWIGRNPEGRAIVYLNKETALDVGAGYSQPYRGRRVAVLDRQALLKLQAQLDAETP
jgi:4-amino-4-deoxy-L-arabinose transferase-like glycosyltransferase